MLIDLTNDAPMIEADNGSLDTGITLTTATNGTDEDSVSFTFENEAPVEIEPSASARSRTTAGKKVVEYSVRERDMPDYGTYEVKCWTRRGQERTFKLTFKASDDKALGGVLIVHPGSTPCSWVCGNEVYTFKTDAIEIPVPNE